MSPRYAQCDSTCTTDCGHCKGAGRPRAASRVITDHSAAEADLARIRAELRERLDRLNDVEIDRALRWLAHEVPDAVNDALDAEGATGVSPHLLRIEFDGGFPTLTIVCNEPPTALCRADFRCGCEELAAVGMGEDGKPWHELTDGYMTDEDRANTEAGTPTLHYGEPGGECNYALWINASDCVDEHGTGTAYAPVEFTWDGDDYVWTITQGGAS